MNYFSLRFTTHYLLMLLQLSTHRYEFMCKLTCYFIFVFLQDAVCI